MADQAYLRIEDVTKFFGDFQALKGISLEIRRGEFVCFLGPSGCGKTTLLRAVAGLDIQTSGRIWQDGRDISALPPAERDFGIVFQSYALFPNLTVNKNVAYGLQNRKRPRAEIEARVAELLTLVGLPEQGRKYPAQLSGGQQQRVALARALATSPGLLLLDEPLSALDAKVRARLRHEIKDLQQKLGVTTIMVTHDQEEALTMADRIVVMNHGVVDQIGTPEEIYSHPASAFVADFIGTMNFAPAEVTAPGRVRLGGVELNSDDTGLPAGTPVTLAIRPEDIIAPAEAAPAEERTLGNVVSARLGDFEFLGYFVRADLALPGLPEGTLRCDLSHNRIRRLGMHEGQEVKVAFPASRLRLYPRAEGAARP
jgi:iron(III) transport system ATP-binding protein